MANRTKIIRQDQPRFKLAFGDPELGDLVFNLLASQTGGDITAANLTSLTQPGAIAGTGIVAREWSMGPYHATRLTLTARSITMTDEAGVVAYGGTKLYDFPPGAIRIKGVSVSVVATKSGAGINTDFDGDWSMGTATASNNATLTSTEANIVPTTATTQAVAGVTTISRAAVSALPTITDNTGGVVSDTIANTAGAAPTTAEFENAVASIVSKLNLLIAAVGLAYNVDGTATAVDLYFNMLVDDADQDGGGAILLTGTIDFLWENLGDV